MIANLLFNTYLRSYYSCIVLCFFNFSFSYLRFEITYKEMAAIIQIGFQKVKNVFHPYLYDDNKMGLILGLVEQTIHVERSLIATGMLLSFFFAS